ncbi:hypothetical protein CU048_03685 [Beijerinckiaceae bacterium]|nr:hypothetical protein CU048_03685 [Beijerinckiaceae bacterium]
MLKLIIYHTDSGLKPHGHFLPHKGRIQTMIHNRSPLAPSSQRTPHAAAMTSPAASMTMTREAMQ